MGLSFFGRGIGVATFAIAGLATSASHADTLTATRFDAIEKEHRVDLTMARGSARFVVTRTVQNTGDKSDQAIWMITPPPAGVAIGLRTAGEKPNGQRVWFDGELMEAEAAAKKYRELTGIGGYYPKDPALLSWRSATQLALQVFPVPGRGDKTIEYTMVAATTFEAGAHVITLPVEERNGTIAPTVVVKSGESDSEVWSGGVKVPDGTIVRAAAAEELRFELRPKTSGRVEGHVAGITVGQNRAVSHVQLFTSSRLSRIPERAAVVIVIDASRSMISRLPAATAAARSFVSHFPSAEVDVVTFDRKVHRQTKAPVSPKEAMVVLHGLSERMANGSRLDDAIAFADDLLAQRSSPERRMLVLTDVLTRESLTPAKLAARAIKSGATVHMAQVEETSEATLTRDDEDAWGRLARRTGGVYWQAAHPERVDSKTRAVFEEWVRPMRIDHVRLLGASTAATVPTTLAEGEGFEDWSIAPFSPDAVTIRGVLWSRPFDSRITTSDRATKLSAALVFGSQVLADLKEPEMMILAKKGGAVSPVTSYLAIEPGVRPSTEGLDWGTSGTGSGSGFGSGSGRLAGVTHGGVVVDKAQFLARALADAGARCKARGELSATIEATFAEIVEVSSVVMRDRDAAIESCVSEALWGVELPGAFRDRFRKYAVAAKL